ncbi:MAG: phosphonatase-like hydrolase [Anaerolineaceae bacterium]|nr:phosphonatase-like hydrolase [Anaerolineaceae bacterium]
MLELELVVFDMAGTVVVDDGQVPAAFTTALSSRGFDITTEQIKNVRGSSKRQAILSLIPPGPGQVQLAGEVYAAFKDHLAQQYAARGVRAIPGAQQIFDLLRRQGARVVLNTGFDRDTTGILLNALAWDNEIVDGVVCGDDVKQGRPAPYLIFRAMESVGVWDVHKVANVGDTVLDLQAGYHAGVRWNIGVLSGAHDRQTLETAPYTHIFASVADLNRLWLEEFHDRRG